MKVCVDKYSFMRFNHILHNIYRLNMLYEIYNFIYLTTNLTPTTYNSIEKKNIFSDSLCFLSKF